MELDLEPGAYVVAVSGGVDSMVLLHVLKGRPDLKLTVAHLDHGIRPDSAQDRQLVQAMAKSYGLSFAYDTATLGSATSEDVARKARYEFLNKVRQATQSRGIVTAHQQDDLLETVIMKLLRGTGRGGFSALRSSPHLHRPMLHLPKHAIKRYALDNQIKWREDSTNVDTKYLRNYVRSQLLPKLNQAQKQQLLDLIHHTHDLNQDINSALLAQLHLQPAVSQLLRRWFIDLPNSVAGEVMTQWLRNNGLTAIDRRLVSRAVVGAKTLAPGKQVDLLNGYRINILPKVLALKIAER